MNVIVSGTMNQQEMSFKLSCIGDRRGLVITFCVFVRTLKEAFGVNIVIIAPAGNRSSCNTYLIGACSFRHDQGSGVASETPSPDAKAIFVYIAQALEV